MTSWLLSITGIIFMGVLFDLIYPNGKTNSLCKTIFGVVAVVVMITPILNIDISKITFESEINNELIENINEAKVSSIQDKIEVHLSGCGIDGVIVRIDANLSNDDFEIDKIYIDTTNLVLSEKVTNINKYEVIIKEVSSLLKIESEKVVVYG